MSARRPLLARPVGAVTLITAVAISGAGCGGPIHRDELERGVTSLQSTAAEGQLLARETARRRLRDPFTRVHARQLSETATHEAEKLNDADATGDTLTVKRHATQLAQDISDALGQLQVAPDDPAVARETARKLADAVSKASDLERRL
jgi:hypothetical protein